MTVLGQAWSKFACPLPNVNDDLCCLPADSSSEAIDALPAQLDGQIVAECLTKC